MTITYLPDTGIQLNGILIPWNCYRGIVRKNIFGLYTSKDSEIDMSIYHSGDKSFNIIQKRDIYESLHNNSCLVFFNYDINDLLKEIEIHNGVEVRIESIIISFEKNINDIIAQLKKISKNIKFDDREDLVFVDLKLVVESQEAMGGEGDNLGYIYMTRNIDHLVPI